MTKQESEPTCLCGGVGSMMRITDKAMVKCTLCKGTGVRTVETRGGVMATVDLDTNCDYCKHRAKLFINELVRDLEDPNLGVLIRHYCADELRSLMESIKLAEARNPPPVAPDPALREAIREAVKAGMLEEKDRLKDGSVKEIFDSTTKAVLAVLAERGIG